MKQRATAKDLLNYTINSTIHESLAPPEEPDDYVTDIEGSILYESGPREGNPPQSNVVARLSAYLVRLGEADEHHQDRFEVFDAHSDTLAGYWNVLFSVRTRELRPALRRQFELSVSDVLILDTLEIEPEHRGKRLGLSVVDSTIRVFARDPFMLVVCNPFPMQCGGKQRDDEWRARMEPSRFVGNKNDAQQRLQRYWQRLGFTPIGTTGYYALSPGHKRPSLAELLR